MLYTAEALNQRGLLTEFISIIQYDTPYWYEVMARTRSLAELNSMAVNL